MDIPRTIEELSRLYENKIQENVHLDYKASVTFNKNNNSVRADLGKDISALANSDGGVLIFGMLEDKETGLPSGLDGGVPHATLSRERLEDLISTAISPQVPGLEIIPIPATPDASYYVIAIPKSFRGPHQELVEHRYYKRANFKNRPMEDYEVRDLFARREVSQALISVDVDIRKGIVLDLVVRNVGDATAADLRFRITPPLEKLAKAKLLNEGARFFPPGKTLRFFFGSATKEIREHEAPKFDVDVSYRNARTGQTINEIFHFDLSDYVWSAVVDTEVGELTKVLKDALEKMTREIGHLRAAIERLAPIAGSTGLDLSVSTLRNLRRLSRLEDLSFPKMRAASCSDSAVFAEVLEVDHDTAQLLFQHAVWGEGRPLEEVEGLSPEVIERARRAFDFEERPISD